MHFIVFGCIYLYLKKLQLIAALTFLMVFHSRYARFVTKNAWSDDRGNRIKDDINLIHWYWTLFALLVFTYWFQLSFWRSFLLNPKGLDWNYNCGFIYILANLLNIIYYDLKGNVEDALCCFSCYATIYWMFYKTLKKLIWSNNSQWISSHMVKIPPNRCTNTKISN